MESVLEVNNVDYAFLDVFPFKENLSFTIKEMMRNNITISEIISFYGYGIIEFEDSKHEKWNITIKDDFKKNKINALIFKVQESETLNPSKFEYIVVYNNVTKTDKSFGYYWYSKSNNKILTRVSLDDVPDVIIQSIVRDIHSFTKQKLYKALSDQLNYVEYKKIYEEYIKTYRSYSYEQYTKNNNTNLRWLAQ